MKRSFAPKLSTLLVFGTAIALGISLFWVSQKVQVLEREQKNLAGKLQSEEEGMRVLYAEWDYLNRPDRIEALAVKYLDDMQILAPDNLLRDARAVPEPHMMAAEDEVPVMVSTEDITQSEHPVERQPDARPIKDGEDARINDFDRVLFDRVLKDATRGNE